MTALTFDTLKFAKTLEAAGISNNEAEAIAEAFKEASEGAEITTKIDLALSTAELKKDIAEMKYDLMKWVIGLAFAQIGLLIGVLLKLPH